MKRIYNIVMLFAIALCGLSLTACDEDNLDTNQFKGGVSLNVYGPQPVARGGVLRFIGSNMDKVVAVVIPGCNEITDIEVVSTKEIRVVVPQTAEPGFVVLKTSTGEIKTLTQLTYSEPISVDEEGGISPNPVRPGDVLTIKGDYLNLIREIIFAEKQTVGEADFLVHSRKEIQVRVPEAALTGDVTLADAPADDEEAMRNLIIVKGLEIVLPAAEVTQDLTDHKPGDVITVKGSNLDLVRQVLMPSGDEVEFTYIPATLATKADVEVGEGSEKIVFTLPENVSNGAIVMVPASGVQVAIANIGVAVPAEVKADPAEDLRAGDVITLTGVNMELVTSITFPGVTDAVAEFDAQSTTEVKVEMPAATISGDLVLNTASGQTATVAIATQKPEFLSFTAAELSLGKDVTIQGKNLDLVAKVIFTGGAEVEVKNPTATEITFAMPTTGSESGVLTLVMANGETVETASLTINAPECCYIPTLPGEDEELKGGEILTIAVENGDKLTSVEVDGKTVKHLINGNTLVIAIPQMANAKTMVKLISTNGFVEYPIAFIPATEIKNEVWSGLTTITWDNKVLIPASAFENVPAGALMVVHYAQVDNQWDQAHFEYGDWSAVNFTEGEVTFEKILIPTNVYGWTFGNRSTPLVLTQEILDNIRNKQGEVDGVQTGIMIRGTGLTFSSVTLEWTVSLETTVWEGSLDMADWKMNHEMKPQDMFVTAGLEAGQTLRLYFDVYGAAPKVKLFDGHWGGLFGGAEQVPDANGVLTYEVDEELATKLTTLIDWEYAFIVQGGDCTLTKVTIE